MTTLMIIALIALFIALAHTYICFEDNDEDEHCKMIETKRNDND